MLRTHYDVLGVRSDATEATIRAAFRRLSLKHHPDRSRAANAERRFVEITRAYEILSDPDLRWEYDDLLDLVKAGTGRVRPEPRSSAGDVGRPNDLGPEGDVGDSTSDAPPPPMTFLGAVSGMGCLSMLILGIIAAVSVGVTTLFPRTATALAVLLVACSMPLLSTAFSLARQRWMARSPAPPPFTGVIAGWISFTVVAGITAALAGWVWYQRPARPTGAGVATAAAPRTTPTASRPSSAFYRTYGPAAAPWAVVTPVNGTTLRVENGTALAWGEWSVVLNPSPSTGPPGPDDPGEPNGGFRDPSDAGTTLPPLAAHASAEVPLGDCVNQTTGERFTHLGYKLLRVGVHVHVTDDGRQRSATVVVPVN